MSYLGTMKSGSVAQSTEMLAPAEPMVALHVLPSCGLFVCVGLYLFVYSFALVCVLCFALFLDMRTCASSHPKSESSE